MSASTKLNIFEVMSASNYKTKSRGTEMLLAWNDKDKEWVMQGVNAASRAYRSYGSYKVFKNLEDVEHAYKGWVGIAEFHAITETNKLLFRVSGQARNCFLDDC